MSQDAFSSLQELGDQLRIQLSELPEYRALIVIDRTLQELSDIWNPPSVAAPSLPGASPAIKDTPSLPVATMRAAPQRAEAPPSAAESIGARAASFSGLTATRPSALAR